jgi:hypothetical protein
MDIRIDRDQGWDSSDNWLIITLRLRAEALWRTSAFSASLREIAFPGGTLAEE